MASRPKIEPNETLQRLLSRHFACSKSGTVAPARLAASRPFQNCKTFSNRTIKDQVTAVCSVEMVKTAANATLSGAARPSPTLTVAQCDAAPQSLRCHILRWAMSREMSNGTVRMSLQSIIHVETLLFRLHSRRLLVEEMNIMPVMNDVFDFFNSTIIELSMHVIR
jgi:hypothetical protein